MQITNIKIGQKRALGNYESIEFMAEASFAEDESVNEATAKLYDYVDWHAQKTMRDGKARMFRLALADENTTPEKRNEAERWLAIYDERKAKMESM